MSEPIRLPDELVFRRLEDFDGFAPLTDEEWMRFWAAMCEFYIDWTVKYLRNDVISEDDNVIHVDFAAITRERDKNA